MKEPPKERPIAVYVSRHDREGRKPLYMAYTYWFDPAWKSGRVFTVHAVNGTQAKKLAIQEAKTADAIEALRSKSP